VRCVIAALVLAACAQGHAGARENAGNAPAWNWPKDAREVTCGVVGSDGKVFVGTLRSGILVVDPNTPKPTWNRVGVRNGLGQDEITALHLDRQGRLWAGHRSEGVSVCVGDTWHHYPPGRGPAGQRVWDIAECPEDGDIWIAHDRGLSRYGAKDRHWQHITRVNGLPTWHVRCLAFDNDGTLIVGTQAEGLLVAKREARAYPAFDRVEGPVSLTRSATGDGLPSGLINDVLVDKAGRWVVATDRGLAISQDSGKTFTYYRGQEWSLKLEGLANRVSPAPEATGQEAWLPDDYVSTLAEDAEGRVWLGFWRGGVMALEPGGIQGVHQSVPHKGPDQLKYQTSAKAYRKESAWRAFSNAFCARAILPRPGEPTLVLAMGSPGYLLDQAPIAPDEDGPAKPPLAIAVIPSPETTAEGFGRDAELAWARQQLEAMPQGKPALVPLPDDWATQGDWIGTYGGVLGVLCAGQGPKNIQVGTRPPGMRYFNTMGPHKNVVTFRPSETSRGVKFSAEDTLRYWVWEKFTTDRRALQLPPDYVATWIEKQLPKSKNVRGNPAMHRRPSGIDDHAEGYPVMFDGPHVQVALDVPAGVHQLAFYFLSYDGEAGANRARDHRLRVHHHTNRFLNQIGDIDALPALQLGRVVEYYPGVYKKFLVRGPLRLAIEVNRNHSFNTMLSGVFMDAWPDDTKSIPPPSPESLSFVLKP
jgi:hypothetical protein